MVALGVVVLSGGLGVTLGLLAGYYGGKLDAVVMRLADTLFSFSTTLIAFLMLGLFKQRGVMMVIIAIAVVDWVRYARTMRGSVLEAKQEAVHHRGQGHRLLGCAHPSQTSAAQRAGPHLCGGGRGYGRGDHDRGHLEFSGRGRSPDRAIVGHDDLPSARITCTLECGGWCCSRAGPWCSSCMGINLFADWLREELNPKISRRR